MRRAVIVVGSHHVGKSKTIRKYLKPKLGINRYQHKFRLKGRKGFVLSQSREEAVGQEGFILSQSLEESGNCKNVVKIIKKYSRYDFLVLAARPSDEGQSCLNRLKSELMRARYRVNLVDIVKKRVEQYYKDKADEILRHLNK